MKILRLILYVLIALAVLLAVAIVLIKYVRPTPIQNENTNTFQNANTEPVTTNENVNQSDGNANVTPEPIVTIPTGGSPSAVEANLKSIARSFAERFGTYSNHSNYENISHLMPYMSQKMKSWAADFLASKAANPDYSGIYHGLTTRALAAETISFDANGDTAEMLIKTQRKESTGSTSNSTIYYQDISVQFVKEEGVWKVADAIWK